MFASERGHTHIARLLLERSQCDLTLTDKVILQKPSPMASLLPILSPDPLTRKTIRSVVFIVTATIVQFVLFFGIDYLWSLYCIREQHPH